MPNTKMKKNVSQAYTKSLKKQVFQNFHTRIIAFAYYVFYHFRLYFANSASRWPSNFGHYICRLYSVTPHTTEPPQAASRQQRHGRRYVVGHRHARILHFVQLPTPIEHLHSSYPPSLRSQHTSLLFCCKWRSWSLSSSSGVKLRSGYCDRLNFYLYEFDHDIPNLEIMTLTYVLYITHGLKMTEPNKENTTIICSKLALFTICLFLQNRPQFQ